MPDLRTTTGKMEDLTRLSTLIARLKNIKRGTEDVEDLIADLERDDNLIIC